MFVCIFIFIHQLDRFNALNDVLYHVHAHDRGHDHVRDHDRDHVLFHDQSPYNVLHSNYVLKVLHYWDLHLAVRVIYVHEPIG